jgi:lysophospholipase L1-like esterase
VSVWYWPDVEAWAKATGRRPPGQRGSFWRAQQRSRGQSFGHNGLIISPDPDAPISRSTSAQPWRRYVALGDSLTEGLEDPYPDGRLRGWADRLAQHLADRGGESIQYANLAVRGRLLGQILAEQVELALALQPDLVSIWGGGNDMLRLSADPDAMAIKLEEAVARLRGRGIDVLVGLGVDSRESILKVTRPRNALYNTNIWSLARRQDAFVMDIWGMRSLRDWRMWHDDRMHLNSECHERVSQCALVALGLAPDREDWDEPLPPLPPMSRRERYEWNRDWAAHHLRPWISRRMHRTSSGAGRLPKQPTWVTIAPTPSSAPTP